MLGRTGRFDPHPGDPAGYSAARRWLRKAFVRWARDNASAFGPDCFEELVHYKWGYLDGHLTRWRRADLDKVLLELFPAKVVVEDGDLDDVIPEARTFVHFLAQTSLLDPASDKPDVLCAHLENIEDLFRRRMAERSRYSPGKRFWLAAADAGVALDDQKAVTTFAKQFNARPDAEREAILRQGAPTPTRHRPGRATPSANRPVPRQRRRKRR
jgi:hypothetical protein